MRVGRRENGSLALSSGFPLLARAMASAAVRDKFASLIALLRLLMFAMIACVPPLSSFAVNVRTTSSNCALSCATASSSPSALARSIRRRSTSFWFARLCVMPPFFSWRFFSIRCTSSLVYRYSSAALMFSSAAFASRTRGGFCSSCRICAVHSANSFAVGSWLDTSFALNARSCAPNLSTSQNGVFTPGFPTSSYSGRGYFTCVPSATFVMAASRYRGSPDFLSSPMPTRTMHPGASCEKYGSEIHFSSVARLRNILRICASEAGTASPPPSSSSSSETSLSSSRRPRERAAGRFSRWGKIPSRSSSSRSSSVPYSSESSSESSCASLRSFLRAISASALDLDVVPRVASSPATRLDLRPAAASASAGRNFFFPPASRSFFSRAIAMMRARSAVCARLSRRSARISSRSSSVIPASRARSSSSPIRSSPNPSPWGSFGSSPSEPSPSDCASAERGGGRKRRSVVSLGRARESHVSGFAAVSVRRSIAGGGATAAGAPAAIARVSGGNSARPGMRAIAVIAGRGRVGGGRDAPEPRPPGACARGRHRRARRSPTSRAKSVGTRREECRPGARSPPSSAARRFY